MDENCKRQKEVERTYGGLLPAVEGHSLGTGTGTHFTGFLDNSIHGTFIFISDVSSPGCNSE